MSVVIPCAPGADALWTQRSTLDGTDYLLTFDWSQRAGWTLSLADAAGAPIVEGCLLTTGSLVLRGVTDARRPPGELVVVDMQGDSDPGFSTLGSRHLLMYAGAAELGR